MTPIDKAIQELTNIKKKHEKVLTQIKQKSKRNNIIQTMFRELPTETKQVIVQNIEEINRRLFPTPSKGTSTTTKTSLTTKTRTTRTKTNFSNHPDYTYDSMKKRWVKKSNIRPVELVNRYKEFLIEFLEKNTTLAPKEIEKIVRKHATSSERLKKILVEKGAMTITRANELMKKNRFWGKELCHHMKTICPAETNLSGVSWCKYTEETFFLNQDKKTKHVSCYTVPEVVYLLNTSFVGGDDPNTALFQLPRDPYTRKVFTPDFMRAYLKHLRFFKEDFNFPAPHVLYFLRNYKKFYTDPIIKPFLKKNVLTDDEKWQVSDAIEKFLTKTNEIEHGWVKGPKRWWFWKDGKEPEDQMAYIYGTI